MVANAGEEGSIPPLVGAGLLAAVLLSLLAIALLADHTRLIRQVPFTKSPEILQEDARRVLQRLGYTEPPKSSANGFFEDVEYLRYVADHDPSPERWAGLKTGQPAAMYFWYVQSPRYLFATYPNANYVPGVLTPFNLPSPHAGDAQVYLDLKGRLIEFRYVPRRDAGQAAERRKTDWKLLLDLAGLPWDPHDPARQVPPQWLPPVFADERVAWHGVYPDRPGLRIRVEAAAYRGQPVYFRVADVDGPWSRPERTLFLEVEGMAEAAEIFNFVSLVLTAAVALLAWRNLRLGRGDRRGAFRLALYFFALLMLAWGLFADHVPALAVEVGQWLLILGSCLFFAGTLWVFYLALEPYVRRRWPWRIVSWNRLLAGRWRDPLIGRDVLIGGVLGVAWILLGDAAVLAPTWFGLPPPAYHYTINDYFLDHPLTGLLICQSMAILNGLGSFILLFLLVLVCRKEWLAVGVLIVLLVTLVSVTPLSAPEWSQLLAAGLAVTAGTVVLLRFGLLPIVVGLFVYGLLFDVPPTLDRAVWYAGTSWVYLLALVGLAGYGFVIALGGRPLFGKAWLGEE
jgi:serine/threonine-protein kinase